jgi:hypothetical protein
MLASVKVVRDRLMCSFYGDGPREIETGIYVDCAFNFTNQIDTSMLKHEKYSGPILPELSFYGVVDSVEQWKETFRRYVSLKTRYFAVGLTEVVKSEQTPEGGWRWHKWGPYYGTKNPQFEYLYNEGPDIESVFTFYVVELKKPTRK